MQGILEVSFLVAGALFILSLSGLANQETARRGNFFGILGILIAIAATALNSPPSIYPMLASAILVAAILGALVARQVQMTAMPELVAILHSFVGLAAVLIGFGAYLEGAALSGAEKIVHEVEIFLGIFIGAITFTGSIVAFGKLKGTLSGKSLLLPGRHFLNLAMVVGCCYLGVQFLLSPDHGGIFPLAVMTAIACLLGIHMVMAIGGADMPVVVSMLNSYSGWAAAATGFMLKNDLLIITGALVGSSGAILSYVMCAAMNRSFFSVILGGFGTGTSTSGPKGQPTGEAVSITVEEVASALQNSKNVVIVPGYGLAVAQAQHPVWEVTRLLKESGVNVRFAIHPVAGRLPGHMNVLLAEANVPYDIVLEMDEINADFPETDVVLVIGANDIVNPGAQDDESSPIYGMPVLEVWKADTTVVLKRSMGTGYSGVDNPLFYKENNRMLFGDAKKSIDGLLTHLRS